MCVAPSRRSRCVPSRSESARRRPLWRRPERNGGDLPVRSRQVARQRARPGGHNTACRRRRARSSVRRCNCAVPDGMMLRARARAGRVMARGARRLGRDDRGDTSHRTCDGRASNGGDGREVLRRCERCPRGPDPCLHAPVVDQRLGEAERVGRVARGHRFPRVPEHHGIARVSPHSRDLEAVERGARKTTPLQPHPVTDDVSASPRRAGGQEGHGVRVGDGDV
jgi:hypothetical protein